jgi:hypothetical protein
VSHAASARSKYRLAVAVAGAALLATTFAGCASRPQVSGDWAQGASHQGFSRVMVVGLSPDLDSRCPFERFMVAQIRALGTAAIMSCEVMDPPTPLTREALEKAVVAQKADAVIATKLVNQSWDTKTGGTMDTRGGGEYKAVGSGWATGYYGMYGVPVVYAEFETLPSVTELQGKVSVQTRVFSVAGQALVYEMDTTVGDITSTGGGLYQLTEPIAKHLERAGLLQ